MSRDAVSFEGTHGKLAGLLEKAAGPERAVALFAHCFTCGKNSRAATRVSRALAAKGVTVLRFDFTGLGGSDGDLSNAGFAGNVEDLVAAAAWLEAEHQPPALLIGHSLGGTAVLAAAAEIPSSKAVVTIGAPADPGHVLGLFDGKLDEIDAAGSAEVELAGRRFTIGRNFVNELRDAGLSERVRRLRRALLIMHSPVDEIVEIDEASRIFSAALHPKSFVSLDDADHLLTQAADADYVADTITGWMGRYLPSSLADETGDRAQRPNKGEVAIHESNRRFLRAVVTDDHDFAADEPTSVGGDNLGPDPYELLLASLGACTSMTLRMYANRKRWDLADVDVELDHRRVHAKDCEDCEKSEQKLEVLSRRIHLSGNLDAEQRARLLEIADRCPVHRTLTGRLEITSESAGDRGAAPL